MKLANHILILALDMKHVVEVSCLFIEHELQVEELFLDAFLFYFCLLEILL